MQFKLFALAPQISIRDATGKPLMFVRQKLLKLKEHVQVYGDEARTQLLFEIRADRLLDFSANYSFTSPDGSSWGSVRRKGARSIWQAHYEVIEDGQIDMVIQEEKPWKRLVEALLGEIPVLGLVAILLINPSYLVSRPDGQPLLRVTKKPAFFEGRFVIDKLNDLPEDDEIRVLLGLIMLTLLERNRG